MKVLLGADQYPEYINGAANFTARLAQGLANRGHAVDLLWPSAQGRPSSHVEDGVRVHRLTSIALPAQPRMHVCAPWSVRRFPELSARWVWGDLQRVFAGADLLSAPTQRAVDLLAAATTLPSARVISCGIDLARYPQRAAIVPDHPTTVLFVGRLEQEKHVDELLRAVARLPQSHRTGSRSSGWGACGPSWRPSAAPSGWPSRSSSTVHPVTRT